MIPHYYSAFVAKIVGPLLTGLKGPGPQRNSTRPERGGLAKKKQRKTVDNPGKKQSEKVFRTLVHLPWFPPSPLNHTTILKTPITLLCARSCFSKGRVIYRSGFVYSQPHLPTMAQHSPHTAGAEFSVL